MKKGLDEESTIEETEDSEEEIEEETEESGLEEPLTLEEPKLNFNFNNLNFSQFTPPVETISGGSPVLESIESRIDRPGFVQMGTGSGVSESSPNNVGGRDTYIPSQGGDDGPKYIKSEGEVGTNVGRVDMQSLGRGVGGFNIPQPGNFFISSESDFQSRNVEHVGMQPGRVDMKDIGRKNPLEAQEKKYEEHKKYEFERPK